MVRQKNAMSTKGFTEKLRILGRDIDKKSPQK